jgi:cytosine/adenosine deaminase-related metal-dependent hydrolase
MPGVQTFLPIMLDHVAAGRLSLARLIDLMSAGPARVWGLAAKGRLAVGFDGDLTLVDLAAQAAPSAPPTWRVAVRLDAVRGQGGHRLADRHGRARPRRDARRPADRRRDRPAAALRRDPGARGAAVTT